jgi:hypothetical protein
MDRLQHLEKSQRIVQVTPDAVTDDGVGNQLSAV